MGGMTALGIMAQHPEVRAVACLMGSGYFTSLADTLFPPAAEHKLPNKTHLKMFFKPGKLNDRELVKWGLY